VSGLPRLVTVGVLGLAVNNQYTGGRGEGVTMTTEIDPQRVELARASRVCKEIAEDMARDAKDFDGRPFNGRTVAEYFGNQGAAIAALANIIALLIEAREPAEKGRP
jgi:hypothetical protein